MERIRGEMAVRMTALEAKRQKVLKKAEDARLRDREAVDEVLQYVNERGTRDSMRHRMLKVVSRDDRSDRDYSRDESRFMPDSPTKRNARLGRAVRGRDSHKGS